MEARLAEDRIRLNIVDFDTIDEHNNDIKDIQNIVRTQFGLQTRLWQACAIRDVARRKLDAHHCRHRVPEMSHRSVLFSYRARQGCLGYLTDSLIYERPGEFNPCVRDHCS